MYCVYKIDPETNDFVGIADKVLASDYAEIMRWAAHNVDPSLHFEIWLRGKCVHSSTASEVIASAQDANDYGLKRAA
jgi:hypothetical protein